jgi:TolB-like protein
MLPFTFLGDDPGKQYLTDGMMEAIIFHLSSIEDIRIID